MTPSKRDAHVVLTIRSIDASFDPANGAILYRRSVFSVVWHRDCFPLAETAGVLFEPIEPYVDEGGCLYPVLKDGSFRRDVSYRHFSDVVRCLTQAGGLWCGFLLEMQARLV